MKVGLAIYESPCRANQVVY